MLWLIWTTLRIDQYRFFSSALADDRYADKPWVYYTQGDSTLYMPVVYNQWVVTHKWVTAGPKGRRMAIRD